MAVGRGNIWSGGCSCMLPLCQCCCHYCSHHHCHHCCALLLDVLVHKVPMGNHRSAYWHEYHTKPAVSLIPVGSYTFTLPCNIAKVMCTSIDMHHVFLEVMGWWLRGGVLEEADDLPAPILSLSCVSESSAPLLSLWVLQTDHLWLHNVMLMYWQDLLITGWWWSHGSGDVVVVEGMVIVISGDSGQLQGGGEWWSWKVKRCGAVMYHICVGAEFELCGHLHHIYASVKVLN